MGCKTQQEGASKSLDAGCPFCGSRNFQQNFLTGVITAFRIIWLSLVPRIAAFDIQILFFVI